MDATLSEISPEILRGVSLLNGVVELRTVSPTVVGVFDDLDKLAQAIADASGHYQGVYVTLNPVALPATNKVSSSPTAAKDSDVVCRRWLLIDIDPVRPKDVSSNDAEKKLAAQKTKAVRAFLTEHGFPEPIVADSGNGYHLLYRVDFPNTKEVADTLRNFLTFLASKFDDDAVHVDRKVFNAARIVKAYGSLACKGENTSDRPHRLSKIVKVPDVLTLVTLEQVTSIIPKSATPGKKSGLVIKAPPAMKALPGTDITPEKMETFFDFYGIDHDPAVAYENGTKWRIICPWAAEHSDSHDEASVFLFPEGPRFSCFHDHCADRHWTDYRAYLEQTTDKKFFFATNIAVTPASAPVTSSLVMTKASQITPEVIEWLWDSKIPIGKLTLLAGHPGMGKGLATIDMIARLTTATKWADCPNPNPVSEAILLSSEDAANDTLVPRLMAAKADLARVNIVRFMQDENGERQFSLDRDLPALREALKANPGVKLVVIDPVMNHLGLINSNREQDLRSVLTPLGLLAEEFKVAIVLVAHLNKKSDAEAVTRVGGAMAMVGCVRCSWLFTESQDDEDTRLMIPLKTNIIKADSGLDYHIETEEVTIGEKKTFVARIDWGDSNDTKASQALVKKDGTASVKVSKSDKACQWLSQKLADGAPHNSAELKELAEEQEGIGNTTLFNAYKKLGGLQPVKEKTVDGGWLWQLPKSLVDAMNANGGAQ